jgi:hypothetical protein
MRGRGNPAAAVSVTAAVLVLAALGAAGCSRQPAASRASVESCTQFGMAAIRQHVTVTTLPPACRGLTAAQVESAVGTALRSAGAGVRGKAQRRARVASASHYLAHLFVAVPAPRGGGEPQAAAAPARWISRTALGLTALCTWLVTLAIGLGMMARWVLRARARGGPARRSRRPPALNFAHLGLAVASLLIWIAYLATGLAWLAWAAVGLLPLVTGLGMALVFLPVRPGGPPPGRRMPVAAIGAHVIFATATILFALLAAIGTG